MSAPDDCDGPDASIGLDNGDFDVREELQRCAVCGGQMIRSSDPGFVRFSCMTAADAIEDALLADRRPARRMVTHHRLSVTSIRL
jgi:hypothetical protein